MMKTTIIIADDHSLIRVGLKKILDQNKSYKLLGEASNGKEAIELIKETKPDIAILDIEMPMLNGLQVCKELKSEHVSTKILLLTMLKEEDLYQQAIELGVNGYLLKDNAIEELSIAIDTIVDGGVYIGKEIEKMLTSTKSPLIQDEKIAELIKRLSRTEKDILLLISQQVKTKGIAERLFISEYTVKNHRHNISKKLELEGDQNNLLKFALENSAYLK